MNKLRSNKGETLVEVLAGIMIVALSSALFMGMVAAASQINLKVQKSEENFYKEMSRMEIYSADKKTDNPSEGDVTEESGSVVVTVKDETCSYDVDIYHGENLAAFKYGTVSK